MKTGKSAYLHNKLSVDCDDIFESCFVAFVKGFLSNYPTMQ